MSFDTMTDSEISLTCNGAKNTTSTQADGDNPHQSLFLLAMLMSSVMSLKCPPTYRVCVATKCRRVKRFSVKVFCRNFLLSGETYRKSLIIQQFG